MVTKQTLRDKLALWRVDRPIPYPSMLLDFIEAMARQLPDGVQQPDTEEEWQAACQAVRPRLLHSLGLDPMPPRTRLNAQTVGTLKRDGYTVEKVIYEPRPGFYVSAHVYIPDGLSLPAPAILYSLGHWMENAKLEPEVQACCIQLARLGFVVLIYDPLGQGERLGDWQDHVHPEILLVGQCQEGLRVWEAMRSIDYLLTRPEVDPSRIGMTGASGGGLNTVYTCAVDDRIGVSVPVCYVDTFFLIMAAERDRNWDDGGDLCNQVPGVMSYSEMSDLLALFAPKPLCIIAGSRDWMFPIEGTRDIYARMKRLYDLLGQPEAVHFFEDDAEHGYNQRMREVAYGWLCRWLLGEGDGAPIPEQPPDRVEPAPYATTYNEPPTVSMEVLRNEPTSVESPGLCFPHGIPVKTSIALAGLSRKMGKALPPTCPLPKDAPAWEAQRAELRADLQSILEPFPLRPAGSIPFHMYRQVTAEGVFGERILIETEPGIIVPALFVIPDRWDVLFPVIVHVDEWGKHGGIADGTVEALVKGGYGVLSIDVRGTGETSASDFEAASNCLMMERSLFGQRVLDVMRTVDWLWERCPMSVQIDKGRIGCWGSGTAGLLVLYAAALDPRISAAVVRSAPPSYKSLLVEHSRFPLSTYLFDVLNRFDLPQVASLVAPRPLLLADAVDGMRRLISRADIVREYASCRQIYSLLHTRDRFAVLSRTRGTPLGRITRWLRENL
ncbi:MAG: prolyl oligopeptidase family serine peptidase [Chloroflexota bacterium]